MATFRTLFVLCGILCTALSLSAQNTWFVRADGNAGNNGQTAATAVRQIANIVGLAEGDVIDIGPGAFDGANIAVSVFINGTNAGLPAFTNAATTLGEITLTGTDQQVTFDGVRFANATGSVAVTGTGAVITITNSHFDGVGVTAQAPKVKELNVSNSVLDGNLTGNAQNAIVAEGVDVLSVRENTIRDYVKNAMIINGATLKVTVAYNEFTNNNRENGTGQAAISYEGSSATDAEAEIVNNLFDGNYNGVIATAGLTSKMVVRYNKFINTPAGNLALWRISGTGSLVATCNNYGNSVPASTVRGLLLGSVTAIPYNYEGDDNNGSAIGFEPKTAQQCATDGPVKSTTTEGAGTSYFTISEAITASASGATIKVKNGSYNEDLSISKRLNIDAYPGGPSWSAILPDTSTDGRTRSNWVDLTGTVTITSLVDEVRLNGLHIIRKSSASASNVTLLTSNASKLTSLRNCWLDVASNSNSVSSVPANGALHNARAGDLTVQQCKITKPGASQLIKALTFAAGSGSRNISIVSNDIEGTIQVSGLSTLSDVYIRNNNISNAGNDGISVTGNYARTLNVLWNTIDASRWNGIAFKNGAAVGVNECNVKNNSITNSGDGTADFAAINIGALTTGSVHAYNDNSFGAQNGSGRAFINSRSGFTAPAECNWWNDISEDVIVTRLGGAGTVRYDNGTFGWRSNGSNSVSGAGNNGYTPSTANCTVRTFTLALSKTNISCNNANDGTIAATPTFSSGDGVASYAWNSTPAQTAATATGLAAGTYTVTLTSNSGNIRSLTAPIYNPTAITAVVAGTDITCFAATDGIITITTPASGGVHTNATTRSYQYSVKQAGTSTLVAGPSTALSFTGLNAGTYDVYVTAVASSQGSTTTLPVTNPACETKIQSNLVIIRPALLETSSTVTSIICGETKATMTVTFTGGVGPYNIAWTGGGSATGVTSPYTITGLAVGTYTATVTDKNNCTSSTNNSIIYTPVKNVTSGLYYATIQGAIDAAETTTGNVIEVCAGTYAENIMITKSVDLRGPNYGKAGNSSSRVAEALIVPASNDQFALMSIKANNISVRGFSFNGDGPGLADNDLGFGGADVNADVAVDFYRYDGALVSQNVMRNLRYFAINTWTNTQSGGGADGPPKEMTIEDNLIEDMGTYTSGTRDYWGGGMIIHWDMYAKVRNNVMNNVRIGIQTGYLTNPNTNGNDFREITGNTINTRFRGIFFNEHYNTTGTWNVSNNTINGVASSVEVTRYSSRLAPWCGILIAGQWSRPSTFSGNVINASSVTSIPTVGIDVWNVSSDGTAAISGGNISGVGTGIRVDNFEGYRQNTNIGAHASISGVSITPNAGGTGIHLLDSPLNTDAVLANKQIRATFGIGITISGGATGLLLENSQIGVVGGNISNIAFSGQTGDYIKLISFMGNLDAAGASFDGKTGATATLAENFDIEDKITHKLDNSTTGGVRVKTFHIFVTPNSGSINRGIDAAAGDDIVNVKAGTYTGNVTLDKNITVLGPNGANKYSDTRVSEAIIDGSVAITGSGSFFKGFEINRTTLPADTYLMDVTNSNVEVSNNLFKLAGTTSPFKESLIRLNASTVGDVNFKSNSVTLASGSTVPASAMNAIGTSGAGEYYIYGNRFAVSGSNSDAYAIGIRGGDVRFEGNIVSGSIKGGVLVDVTNINGDNSSDFVATGQYQGDVLITYNDIAVSSATGIRVTGTSNNTIVRVEYNNITGAGSSTGIHTSVPASMMLMINNNVAKNSTFINHDGTGSLAADCMWFGTKKFQEIAPFIVGSVTYDPYNVLETDDDLGQPGFQNTADCDGTAVVITPAPTVIHQFCTDKGSITVRYNSNAQGGNASTNLEPYTISWTGQQTGSSSPVPGTPYMITGLNAGTYDVTVTDVNGSLATTNVTVNYYPVRNSQTGALFSTIQAAINDAATVNGNTIELCAGTFTENVAVNKELTINGPNKTVSGTGTRATEAVIDGRFTVAASNTSIAGVKILNGAYLLADGLRAGVYVSGARTGVTVTNSIFEHQGAHTDASRGIVTTSNTATSLTISNNLFTDGGTGVGNGWATGVYVNPGATATVSGNTFSGLLTGLQNDGPNNGTVAVSNNAFTANEAEALTIYNVGSSLTLTGNSFAASNATHIGVYEASDLVDATSNTFAGIAAGSLTLAQLFDVEDKITHSLENPAYGFVRVRASNVYVTPNSSSVQRGINAASAGDVVNIKDGTYTAQAITVNKRLDIKGQGTGTVIQRSGSDVFTYAAAGSGTNATTRAYLRNVKISGSVKGITVSDVVNYLTLDGVTIDGNSGYGIHLNNTSGTMQDWVIQNSTFNANADGFRMGMAANVNGLTITGSTFTNQVASGIYIPQQSSSPGGCTNLVISNNTFTGNASNSNNNGAIYIEKASTATISGNTMTNNGTSTNPRGVLLNLKYGSYSDVTISGNEFVENRGGVQTAGFAINVAARNDAPSYNSNPASLTTLAVTSNKMTGFRLGVAIDNAVDWATANIANNDIINCSTGISAGVYGTGNTTNGAGKTLKANNNSITGFTTSPVTGAVVNYNANGGAVDAECNWYGTKKAHVIAAAVLGAVDYVSYLTSGTDGNAAIGFQPSGSCDGTPVTVALTNSVDLICNGTSTGSLDITASAGTPSYTYAWKRNSVAYATTEDLAGIPAGTYSVTVTDQNESEATASYVVTDRPLFTSGTISSTGETICYAGTPSEIGSTTAASGGNNTITYSWRSSADGYAAAINGAVSATYTPPSGLTSTTSYRRYAVDGLCNTTPEVSTGTWTVTVRPQFSTGGIATTGQTICSGGTPTVIGSVTNASGGDNIITYSWRSSADAYTAAIVGATDGSYTPPAGLTTTTSYRRYAKDGTCTASPALSDGTWTVTVNDVAAGSITGNQTICSGTAAAELGSVDATGSATPTYKWQINTNLTVPSWSDISGATSATYSPGTLTADAQYRRIATSTLNGVACSATSNTITVTVNNVQAGSNAIAIEGSQTICSGGDPVAFTSTGPAIGDGDITYRWESSTNGTNWNPISGATDLTYNVPSGLTTTTQYRRVAISTLSSVACEAASNILTVTINTISAGTIAGDQTICPYTAPPLGFSNSASATGLGTITYQWQKSTDNGSTWSDITNATSATYAAGQLIVDTKFRRVATSTSAGVACSAASEPVTITVNEHVEGSISGNQTICEGGDPTPFLSTADATGDGTITYKWEQMINGTWTEITGATASTYDVSVLNADATYRRMAFSTLNGVVCGRPSASITVAVNNLTAGSINGEQTICNGAIAAELGNATSATGDGSLTYGWQTSGSGLDYDWANIPFANGATYSPGAMYASMYFRRRVTSTLNGVPCTKVTDMIRVTVQGPVTAGEIAGAQTICNGGNPAEFTSTTDGEGSGTITYRWESSTNGTNWTTISGATTSTYDVPAGLTTTTQYRRTTISTQNSVACESVPTASVTVTVQSVPTAGVIAGAQTICNGGNPVAFTSTTDGTGSGTITYRWESSTNGTDWTTVSGATSSIYDVPAGLTTTTRYRRTTISTQNSVVCESVPTASVTVTINDVDAGSISGNQTICEGGDPVAFTSTAPATGSGSITYQWQENRNFTTPSWSNISSATSATYDQASLTVDAQYRRVATSTLGGVACISVSNTVTVTVNNMTSFGSIAGSQTICDGGDPVALTSLSPAEGDGVISYQWQVNTNLVLPNWTDISGATSSTYDPGVLNADVQYRRMAISTLDGVACSGLSGNMVNITVNNLTAGSISESQTICDGGDPAAFTSQAATGDGSITYQWQRNTNIAEPSWSNISGATSETYDAPALTADAQYRRVASSLLYTVTCSAISNVVTVTANNLVAGSISGNQTVCEQGDPLAFTSSEAATGDGTITYQWQLNTDMSTPSWSDITGATSETYDAGTLTADAQYRRVAKSTIGANSCSAISNTVTVTVNNLTAGAISGTQTICNNTAPTTFGNSTAATGDGSVTYQWQWASDLINPDWQDISGANSATYAAGALTATRHYRRVATSSLSSVSCTKVTTPITVTVQSVPTAGMIAGAQTICNGGNPAAFTSTTGGTGSGTITYRWESSTNGTDWTTISGETASTYDVPAGLTTTTQYRRTTISTQNSVACESVPTASVTVTVQSVPTAGVIAGAQTICNGGNPAVFTSTTDGTGSGTITYRWESSTNGTDWTTISGETASTYDVPAGLTTTTQYRRTTISTLSSVACESVPTASVTVTVQSVPTAGVIAAAQTICNGGNPAAFTSTTDGTGSGTITYRWESSTNGTDWTTISGETASTYDVPAGLTTTTHYRRTTISTQNSVACESVPTASVTVTVINLTAGSVGSDQTICYNADPAPFTSVAAASGDGTITYQWQSSGNGSTWVSISGATAETYDVTSNLTATTYYRRVANASLNGVDCQAATSVITVTVPTAQLSANVVKTHITCFSATDGTITVSSPAGGYGTYETSINNSTWFDVSAATAKVFSGLSEGTYTVYLRDKAKPSCVVTIGNSAGGTDVIYRPSQLTFSTSVTHASCNGQADGVINVINPSGGTHPELPTQSYKFSLKNDGNTLVRAAQTSTQFGSLPANLYYITIIADGVSPSCSREIGIIQVDGPGDAIAASVTKTNITCNGSVNGSIEVSGATGGTSLLVPVRDYRYSIVKNGATTTGPQVSGSFTGLGVGTYDVYVTALASGNTPACQALVSTQIIYEPTTVTASVAKTNMTCNGSSNGTITVSSAAGGIHADAGSRTYRYMIARSGGSTTGPQTSATFTGLQAGSYSVSVVAQATGSTPACTTVVNPQMVILQPSPIGATVAKMNISCNGALDGTITVSGTSGGTHADAPTRQYSYRINRGAFNQTNTTGSFTGLEAGTYLVLVNAASEGDGVTPACSDIVVSTQVVLEPAAVATSGTITTTNQTCASTLDATINMIGATGGTHSEASTRDYRYSITKLGPGGTTVGPQTSALFTGLSAGTYDLSITTLATGNSPACTTLIGQRVLTAPTPVTYTFTDNADTTAPYVKVGGTVTFTLTVQGGTPRVAPPAGEPHYAITWSGSNPAVPSFVSSVGNINGSYTITYEISGVSPDDHTGSYSVSVADANACPSTSGTGGTLSTFVNVYSSVSLYVDNVNGSKTTGTGTTQRPLYSITKAIDIAGNTEEIYVMQNESGAGFSPYNEGEYGPVITKPLTFRRVTYTYNAPTYSSITASTLTPTFSGEKAFVLGTSAVTFTGFTPSALYVNNNGSIQVAIDAVTTSAMVTLLGGSGGTYDLTSKLLISKALTLRGVGSSDIQGDCDFAPTARLTMANGMKMIEFSGTGAKTIANLDLTVGKVGTFEGKFFDVTGSGNVDAINIIYRNDHDGIAGTAPVRLFGIQNTDRSLGVRNDVAQLIDDLADNATGGTGRVTYGAQGPLPLTNLEIGWKAEDASISTTGTGVQQVHPMVATLQIKPASTGGRPTWRSAASAESMGGRACLEFDGVNGANGDFLQGTVTNSIVSGSAKSVLVAFRTPNADIAENAMQVIYKHGDDKTGVSIIMVGTSSTTEESVRLSIYDLASGTQRTVTRDFVGLAQNTVYIAQIYFDGGSTDKRVGMAVDGNAGQMTVKGSTATEVKVAAADFDVTTLQAPANTLAASNVSVGARSGSVRFGTGTTAGTTATADINVTSGASMFFGTGLAGSRAAVGEILIYNTALQSTRNAAYCYLRNKFMSSSSVDNQLEKADPSDNVIAGDVEVTDEITVYPNPAESDLNVGVVVREAGRIRVEVVDALGRVVYQALDEYSDGNSIYPVNVDVSKFANGTYAIRVIGANNLDLSKTFIVRH